VRRGEVWTVSGGPDYAGKPRPAVIVQADDFQALDSVTLCPLTTRSVTGHNVRLAVAPSVENGLREPSNLMADRIMTVRKTKLGKPLGRLSNDDMSRLNSAMLVFLGLAAPASTR